MIEGLSWGKRKLINEIIKQNWGDINPEKKIFNYSELLFLMQELFTEEGKPYFEARTSLRGHQIFRNFVSHLLYRNLANYDSMILITSEKGVGKSSAAMMLAREWCRMIGIQFNPKRHIAYNNSDVMTKIDVLRKFEPLICLSGRTRIRIKRNGKESISTIKNLVGKDDYEVLTYNIEDDKFEFQKPKETIKTKKDITYEIELENGIKINATKNHLFLTKEGIYKRLDDLTENDELILPSKKCVVCGKEYFNKQWDGKTCSDECAKKSRIPYRISYPEKAKKWHKERHHYRIKNDVCYRLRHNLHTRLMKFVKGLKTLDNETRTEKIIGCSLIKLKEHLEKQFKKGMNWNNYGSYSKDKWSIDHIIPLFKFDLTKEKERRKCFHYTNIQPLWNKDNQAKGRWS